MMRTFLLVLAALLLTAGCGGGEEEEPLPLPADQPDPVAEALAFLGEPPAEEELARVVARVNGEDVLERKIYQVTLMNKIQLLAQGQQVDEALEAQMRIIALQLVVDDMLLRHEAESAGVTVEPAEVDQMVAQMRTSFGSEQEYRAYIDASGLDEEAIRADIGQRLLSQKYRDRVIAAVDIDEQRLREMYRERQSEFMEGEEVHGRYILVRTQKNDPEQVRADARRRIDEAYAKIQAGENFGEVAKQYSQAGNAHKGGDLGFFPRGVMLPDFEAMAFNSEVGSVTPVFETPMGFNVLEILAKREGTPKPFDEVRPTLLLEATQQEQSRLLSEKLSELRAKATIELVDEGGQAEAGA